MTGKPIRRAASEEIHALGKPTRRAVGPYRPLRERIRAPFHDGARVRRVAGGVGKRVGGELYEGGKYLVSRESRERLKRFGGKLDRAAIGAGVALGGKHPHAQTHTRTGRGRGGRGRGR
jgi:hypothetical protein